jgi:hypothetical protein
MRPLSFHGEVMMRSVPALRNIVALNEVSLFPVGIALEEQTIFKKPGGLRTPRFVAPKMRLRRRRTSHIRMGIKGLVVNATNFTDAFVASSRVHWVR